MKFYIDVMHVHIAPVQWGRWVQYTFQFVVPHMQGEVFLICPFRYYSRKKIKFHFEYQVISRNRKTWKQEWKKISKSYATVTNYWMFSIINAMVPSPRVNYIPSWLINGEASLRRKFYQMEISRENMRQNIPCNKNYNSST